MSKTQINTVHWIVIIGGFAAIILLAALASSSEQFRMLGKINFHFIQT